MTDALSGKRNLSSLKSSHSPAESFLAMNLFQPKCVARLRRRLRQLEQSFIVIEADNQNRNKLYDLIRDNVSTDSVLTSPMYLCVICEETAHEYMNSMLTYVHNTLHGKRNSSYTIVCLGVFPMDKSFINESIQEVSNQTFICHDTNTMNMSETSQWVHITPEKTEYSFEDFECEEDTEPEGIMFHTGGGYIECFDMS